MVDMFASTWILGKYLSKPFIQTKYCPSIFFGYIQSIIRVCFEYYSIFCGKAGRVLSKYFFYVFKKLFFEYFSSIVWVLLKHAFVQPIIFGVFFKVFVRYRRSICGVFWMYFLSIFRIFFEYYFSSQSIFRVFCFEELGTTVCFCRTFAVGEYFPAIIPKYFLKFFCVFEPSCTKSPLMR